MNTYTKAEMLALWRRAMGIDTLRLDMSITRVDGIDIDTFIAGQMRTWYLGLLDSQPLSLVPVTEIASRVVSVVDPDRLLSVALPDEVRRVVSVRLAGWLTAVAPRPASDTSVWCLALDYTTPGVSEPHAYTDGTSLVCAPASGTVASLRAVIDPGPDTYILDESLLATIPRHFNPYGL